MTGFGFTDLIVKLAEARFPLIQSEVDLYEGTVIAGKNGRAPTEVELDK